MEISTQLVTDLVGRIPDLERILDADHRRTPTRDALKAHLHALHELQRALDSSRADAKRAVQALER